MEFVLPGKNGTAAVAMFGDPANEIIRYPDVQSSADAVGQDINEVRSLRPHVTWRFLHAWKTLLSPLRRQGPSNHYDWPCSDSCQRLTVSLTFAAASLTNWNTRSLPS